MFTHKVDEKGDPIEDPEILKKINEEADAKGLDRTKYLKQQLEKGRNIYQLHELSDQERNQLQKVTYTDPKTGKQRVNMSLHLMASLMIVILPQNLQYKLCSW